MACIDDYCVNLSTLHCPHAISISMILLHCSHEGPVIVQVMALTAYGERFYVLRK